MLPCQNPKTGFLVMEAGLNVTLSKSEDRASGHGAHFRIKNPIVGQKALSKILYILDTQNTFLIALKFVQKGH